MAGSREDQDLFDSILLADEKFRGDGYREGFERGTRRGLQDGRRHGASHGARLSSETSNPMCCRKRVKALESLLVLIHNVPLEDPQSATLQENMERLRAKFRQVCSMLSVPADFKDFIRTAEGTSF
ncbi:protein LTO1 homolog isoform X4 [Embiotoca jacksoni]|uniref:protein LTO1 homolog isoform X4 n=1 Tax=Embiotoca jacksoni TaxID=100190 RepID=UPI0037041D9E